MSSQALFEEYLLILKSSVEVYIHGTLESSNDDVRKVLMNGLDETLSHQERVYKKMCECGWYCISNLKANMIAQQYEKLVNSSL